MRREENNVRSYIAWVSPTGQNCSGHLPWTSLWDSYGHCARWVPFAHLTEKEAEALRWKGLGKGHLAPVVDSPYSGAKWASGCPRQLQTGTGHGHVPSTPIRMKLWAAVATDPQQPLLCSVGEFRRGEQKPGALCSGKPGRTGSVQFSSVAQLCPTLCDPMDCSTQGHPVQHQLPELTHTHVHWVGDAIQHTILCHPLLLLLSIFPSIGIFSSESVLRIRWPKYWSFSFSVSPSNEPPGLISFRMDWLDLLAVQGTLKSLLQHHSSKAPILWCSAFFTVQLSHPYTTTGKTIALTRHTFIDKVMSLLFNMLSRLVITFLLRSNHLLISWLQSPSAVILESKKIKSASVAACWTGSSSYS